MDMETEEGIRSVVLRRSETSGLGFSIMGGAGYDFPPVIYGIEKDSPAARSGLLEAGDIILAINEREVVKLSTKEVLKCLRLSGDIVNIKFKRDPHVVSRVRQFLSTPHYVDTPDHVTQHHHIQASPTKRSGVKSQIPVYQYQPQAPHLLSPNSRSNYNPNFSPNHSSGGGGEAAERLIHHHNNQSNVISHQGSAPQSAAHISFTDDLFINHSHQHQAPPSLGSGGQHYTNFPSSPNKYSNNSGGGGGGGGIVNISTTPYQNQKGGGGIEIISTDSNHGGKNGRKNFETFVMTGDAILNLTRNDSNDSYKPSPTKTASKLTPMPQMPVFVEREKDYKRRIQLERQMEKEKEQQQLIGSKDLIHNQDSDQKSDPVTPPLPPPPAPEEIKENSHSSNNNSISNRSDNLPPPPPLEGAGENVSVSVKSQSVKNGHVVGSVGGAPNGCNNFVIENLNRSPKLNSGSDRANREPVNNLRPNNNQQSNNNNEDTSISSSVMSDSGDEMIQDETCEGVDGVTTDQNRVVLKVESSGRNISSACSTGTEKERDAEFTEVVPEKTFRERERYNEYILLNGNGNEDDRSSGKEDLSVGSGRYTGTPPNNQFSSGGSPGKGKGDNEDLGTTTGTGSDDGDLELDESNSECELRGSTGGGAGGEGSERVGSGSSFSGGDSDSSDVESMRVAPVVKAVDLPSAERLAKRLYTLDGFKVSDVWRHLSKSNDFSRAVATEYLKFFEFRDEQLDVSLRKFLAVCPLRGETQERERVLAYFSNRYVECNPGIFGSQDSVHTLTCALMLLNTDMYSGIRNGHKMTCPEFIENLSGLNDGDDFPKQILKQLYHSIKAQPLTSPMDADDDESNRDILPPDPPVATTTMEFKRGYLMRKCTFETGGKKTPLGKRSWKMYFCKLKELLLVLSNDETSKSTPQNTHTLKLHHAFATVAVDYRKRPHVFRLFLADRSQFLYQSSDSREMNSWIEMINWNAARFSSPALEAPCSNTGRFERPLLPSSVTRMSSREQMATHQNAVTKWEEELEQLAQGKTKGSAQQKRDAKEKMSFMQFEIRRYRAYVEVLERRAAAADAGDMGMMGGGGEELVELQVLPNPPILMEMDENS